MYAGIGGDFYGTMYMYEQFTYIITVVIFIIVKILSSCFIALRHPHSNVCIKFLQGLGLLLTLEKKTLFKRKSNIMRYTLPCCNSVHYLLNPHPFSRYPYPHPFSRYPYSPPLFYALFLHSSCSPSLPSHPPITPPPPTPYLLRKATIQTL